MQGERPGRKAGRWIYVVVITGMISFGLYYWCYLPAKANEYDRAALKNLEELSGCLERFCSELKDRNCKCPPLPEWFDEYHLMFFKGPYYGWMGTDGDADVRIRLQDGELRACARNGSCPKGGKTRVIYRRSLLGADLPSIIGECSGNSYAGDLCFNESMLDPKDGSFRFGAKRNPEWAAQCEGLLTEAGGRLQAQEKLSVKGINAVGVNLYRRVANSDANTVISPYGLYEALGLLYGSAGGTTKNELAGLLNIKESGALIHDTLASLRRVLACEAGRGGGTLDIQNSLAIPGPLEDFLPKYLDLAKRTYDATVTSSTLPDKLTMINLITFKSTWQAQFNASNTEDAVFYLLNGTELKVPIMGQVDNKISRYMERDDFEALEMCYEGAKLSMVVFLPKEKNGLPKFERNLSGEKLAEWLRELDTWEWGIHIYVPRFAMTIHHELDKQLRAMGLKSAFDFNTADFTGMAIWATQAPIWVGRMQQEILLEVNEKGTKAVAATISCLNIGGEAPRRKKGQPIIFNADHPFMFIIRHNPTNCILFMGRVTNPDQ